MDEHIQDSTKLLASLSVDQFSNSDKCIPIALLQEARGILLLSKVQGGFIIEATAGSGVLITKAPNGEWSGPCFFGIAGLSIGLTGGLSRSNVIIILKTEEAVESFATGLQISLGAGLKVAAGPLGRDVSVSTLSGEKDSASLCVGYSYSEGLCIGVAIEEAVLVFGEKTNHEFYQGEVSAADIIHHQVKVPDTNHLRQLYAALNKLLTADVSQLPTAREEVKHVLHKHKDASLAEATDALNAAKRTLHYFTTSAEPDQMIPIAILKEARAIAFLTEVKAGLIITGTSGTGILLAKHSDGNWSPPCFWGTAAVGVGFSGGVSRSDVILVFTTDNALQAIQSGNQVKLGVDMEAVAGPVGRDASVDISTVSCYSYSNTKGLFAGIALEGGDLYIKDEVNAAFYHTPNIQPKIILQAKDKDEKDEKEGKEEIKEKPAGNGNGNGNGSGDVGNGNGNQLNHPMQSDINEIHALLRTMYSGGFEPKLALDKQIDRATAILTELLSGDLSDDRAIPATLLQTATAVAIITQLRVGYWLEGEVGSGLILAKTDHGWSPPCALGTGGIGFGALIGASKTDIVLVFTGPVSEIFRGEAQYKLGVNCSMAIGPVGRDLSAGAVFGQDGMPSGCYSYSRSEGLFLGTSIDNSFMFCRDSDNEEFYQKAVPAHVILSGKDTTVVVPNHSRKQLDLLHDLLTVGSTAKDNVKVKAEIANSSIEMTA